MVTVLEQENSCHERARISPGALIFPPYNGDVGGLQSFTTRRVEYLAQGGILYVYNTQYDVLLINDFILNGEIDVVGYVGDVKAIDFF